MPNVTVQAVDSATAMEEIWEKLGPDAMIVSTSKRNGRVIMEATTDAAASADHAANGSNTGNANGPTASQGTNLEASFGANFKDIISGHMLSPTQKNGTKNGPNMAGLKGGNDISSLRHDIASLHDMLGGMILTDQDGINPHLGGSTRLRLQQAGFSSAVVNGFKEHFAGLNYQDGATAFLHNLASHLVHPDADMLLAKRLIFVVGATGTGRTTMVAKLAAMLREQHPTKEIVAASLHGKNSVNTANLQGFGRLLNIPICNLNNDTPVEDFNKMTDYDIMVIDVTGMPEEACTKINAIKTHLGGSDIAVVATLPGSTSRAMIKVTTERFNTLRPMIALTKLDECETTPAEFSALAEQDARIGILSGTKSIVGAAMFASQNILLQYLKENFDSNETWMPNDIVSPISAKLE